MTTHPGQEQNWYHFTVIGLDRFIPRFGSLEQALPPGPAAAAPPDTRELGTP